MSCMVMMREPLAALANAVETRLNIGYDFWGFEAPFSLYRELADCKTSCTYSAELIYRKLYAVNIRAYNGSYANREGVADEHSPDVDIITRRPKYREHGFAVCQWHYQLAMLLDFWLYQTAEDTTYADPLRLAMAEFRDNLYSFIVTNSPGYYNERWGELPRQTAQTVKTGYSRSKEADLVAQSDAMRWFDSEITDMTAEEDEERTFTVTEFCPHCETEISMHWNTDTQGFKAFCPHCGQRLMLCDECHQLGGGCDYDSVTDTCKFNSAREAEYCHDKDKMREIYEAGLPGFYVDARGAYGIIIGKVYIGCFVNDEGMYDVTVNAVYENGDLGLNLDWSSYKTPKEAILQLRHKLKYYSAFIEGENKIIPRP